MNSKSLEQDSQHTRDMQRMALMGDINRDRRAQWMSFAIMLVSLAVTALSVVFGKNIAPGIITGLGTLFIATKVLFTKDKNKSK